MKLVNKNQAMTLIFDLQVVSYTLNQIFCSIQFFVYLHVYLYSIGKIVNKQRIVSYRIRGSRLRCRQTT